MKTLLAKIKYETVRIVAIRPPITPMFFILLIFAGLFIAHTGSPYSPLLFFYRVGINGLAGLISLFGSLFMLCMGADAYGSGKHAASFGNTFIRLALLNIFFLVSIAGLYYHSFRTFGPDFPRFVFYLLLSLTFFYTTGLFLRTISKSTQAAVPYCLFTWFFFTTFGRLQAVGPAAVALFILLLYEAAFLLRRQRRYRLVPETVPRYNFRKGSMYFILCKNNRHKNRLFNYYMAEPGTVCIDAVQPGDYDEKVGPAHLTGYLSALTGSGKKRTAVYLRILGIDLTAPRKELRKTVKEMNRTVMIQKILCATAAADRGTVVVKDFLKGQSRQTERQFLELVSRINHSGRTVVYLSTEIFSASLPFGDDIRIDNYKNFKIDPPAVCLR